MQLGDAPRFKQLNILPELCVRRSALLMFARNIYPPIECRFGVDFAGTIGCARLS